MTKISGSIKFDQQLWDARGEGNRADHEDGAQNPYLASSSMWAAWEAGRAFGLGRVSQARGCAMNVETKHGNYRITFDELKNAPTRVMAITYCYGSQVAR